MTPEQVESARTLLAKPENTVSSIAKLLGVSRSTIYKYVPELTIQPAFSAADAGPTVMPDVAPLSAAQRIPPPSVTAPRPTCGHRPEDARELALHRDGLATPWLTLDPQQIIERRHCERCQPHRASIVMCAMVDTTVMLGDDLAVPDQAPLTQQTVLWLTSRGWRQHRGDWYCGNHSQAHL